MNENQAEHVELCSDSDADVDDDDADDSGFHVENNAEPNTHRELVFEDVIKKVRNTVRTINKSQVKLDILKKHTKDEFGKEITPILDCKTRWSSLANMIKRFLELKSCIQKTMIDIGKTSNFSNHDFNILEEVSAVLEILKVTLESFCRRDANLLTADTALKFCLKKLDSREDVTSFQLANALRKRIKQYRLPEASLLQYLHNSDQYFRDTADRDTFERPVDTAALLAKLYKRLNTNNTENYTAVEDDDVNVMAVDEDVVLSTKEELDREIKKVMQTSANSISADGNEDEDYTAIRIEKALFENGGDRGKHLKKCYDYLLTIPPTSVEAERAFSTAGYFCNKIRSSLSDKSLNSLCVLRSYYQDYRNSYVLKK